jgi:adenine/guanine phosphoribosyltransferase-like PRPP-binding protein
MRQPHHFWQEIEPAEHWPVNPAEGYVAGYPAVLPDARQLLLPIRSLPNGSENGVASLIVNQAGFAVHDLLTTEMASLAVKHAADVIIGVPTLGLTLAMDVARKLSHQRYVPLGTSRKFWYVDDLSEPLASITSPGKGKTVYLDPRMVPVLEGKRVLVVDDVVSTGTSLSAVLRLLDKAQIHPVGVVAAMLQTERWKDKLIVEAPFYTGAVEGIIHSPLLVQRGAAWFVA